MIPRTAALPILPLRRAASMAAPRTPLASPNVAGLIGGGSTPSNRHSDSLSRELANTACRYPRRPPPTTMMSGLICSTKWAKQLATQSSQISSVRRHAGSPRTHPVNEVLRDFGITRDVSVNARKSRPGDVAFNTADGPRSRSRKREETVPLQHRCRDRQMAPLAPPRRRGPPGPPRRCNSRRTRRVPRMTPTIHRWPSPAPPFASR